MRPHRVDFYDPLYDFVTFEEAAEERPRAFFDVGFDRAGADRHGESMSPLEPSKAILPFLSCLQFTRQSFLRQSDLAFLVYPSSTHTRFAHAIGACYLGYLAAQRVGVAEGVPKQQDVEQHALGESSIYLSEFLESSGLREEFYLSLLLHDIGHFPFSHTLDSNLEFWQTLRERISHEAVACDLILGSGPFIEAWKRRVADMPTARLRSHPMLWEVFSSSSTTIEREPICYLISGDPRYIAAKNATQKVQLNVLHELVSGLLDLDRIDHYRRDSWFNGLKTGSNLNFSSMLAGLTICYESSPSGRRPQLCLSASATGQAIALIQAKERLTEDCFEHPENIAYEAMMQNAFNLYVFGDEFYEELSIEAPSPARKELVCDLLISTDDELLLRLSQDGSARVKEIVFRIMNREPYSPVARLTFSADSNPVRNIRERLSAASDVALSDIVIYASRHYGTADIRLRSDEWLSLHHLRNARGDLLVDGKYRRQIEHFKQSQEGIQDIVWAFGTDSEVARRIERSIPGVCADMRCTGERIR